MNVSRVIWTLLVAGGVATVGMAATADADAPLLRIAQAATSHDDVDGADALKMSALEALMTAPPERAFPLVKKVLENAHSDAVKSRALFVLSQIEGPDAQELLLSIATDAKASLQLEAIRMVGIGGDEESLRRLGAVYRAGEGAVRESVLHAYLIAGNANLVYEVAHNAGSEAEFDAAVQTLAAMQATDALHRLYEKAGASAGLLRAYAIAGDLDSLLRIADESQDKQQRVRAIRDIGIVGTEAAQESLVSIYRGSADADIREAALHGLLVSRHDQGVMALFRDSSDAAEKRRLLRTLVNMDSELVLELIDSTLQGDEQ